MDTVNNNNIIYYNVIVWGDMMEVRNKKNMITLIITTTLGVYLSFKFLLPLVAPFIFAYAIASFIMPITGYMEKKLKIPKTIGGTISLIVLLAGVGIGILYLGKNLIEQFELFMKNIPIYQSMMMNSIDAVCNGCDDFLGLTKGSARRFLDGNFNTMMLEVKSNIMPVMTEHTLQAAIKIISVFGTILFTLISVLLILQDKKELKEKYRNLPFYREIHSVTEKLSGAGTAYLKAQMIIILIISVINVCGLLLIKNEYALLIGILIAIIDAFPVLGSGTIFVPWAFVCFISKDIYQAAVLISLYFITQFVRQILEPKLIGDKIGIKPIFTIMSMYAGIKLFGILGFILGPIALITIMAVIKSIEVNYSETQ